PEKTKEPTKFEAYYDFKEKVSTIPSHRYLAIRRGEAEGVLRAGIEVDSKGVEQRVAPIAGAKASSPFKGQMEQAVADSLARLLLPSIENDMRVDMKLAADRGAVAIFAE